MFRIQSDPDLFGRIRTFLLHLSYFVGQNSAKKFSRISHRKLYFVDDGDPEPVPDVLKRLFRFRTKNHPGPQHSFLVLYSVDEKTRVVISHSCTVERD
jgi:hypothetical protein